MFKSVENGYITGFGTAGDNCTEEEYAALVSAMENRPTPDPGYGLKLRAGDLEWEQFKLPETDIDSEEALDILLGGRDDEL